MKTPMKKIIAVFALALALLVSASLAEAQKKIPRIGLHSVSIPYLDDAFLQGLRELGYVEGKNIFIERGRGKQMIAKFVRLKVDVMVLHGTRNINTAKKATKTIPIVSAYAGNIVGPGKAVTSLAKPGGNITGMYSASDVLSGKRVELLLDLIPKESRIAVLGHPVYPKFKFAGAVKTLRKMGKKVQSVYVSDPKEFQSAYDAMAEQKSGGVVIVRGPFTNRNAKRLLELSSEYRLPTMCEDLGWVSRGCLLSYNSSNIAMHRRAAYFVDKILKGANPGDLPVEQPRAFELVLNLKTAEALGLTIPPTVLFQADKVIK